MTDDPDPSRTKPVDIAIAIRTHSPLWRARLPAAPAVVERAARAALAGARASGPIEVSFLLANDARVRRLNRDFRGQDKPTNVLSFPVEEREAMPAPEESGTGPRLLGDVVFAFETLEREAAAQSKPLSDHLSHLAVHGVLHLLGYDHGATHEANRMEHLEARVLAGLGIADPYARVGQEAGGRP
jgi:probable rRNA maturation factor